MLVQAKNSKGFTLVELIVVITILAILATIGFLSLQGYTSDAKDAKVRANIRTVTSALVNEQAMSNNATSTYVTTNAAYAVATSTSSGALYGNGGAFSGAGLNGTGTYFAGDVNASALRIDSSKFFDTNTGATVPFAIGAVNFTESVNGKNRTRPLFQVAATIKGAAQTAVVEGNYGTGATTDVQGLIAATTNGGQAPVAPGASTLTNASANTNGTASSGLKPVLNGSTTNIPYYLY